MTITRTRITVGEGEEDNEGCGDGWVHADSVDAETATGDVEDDDVPVDINKSPETTKKKTTERLIDNDYYGITQDWMIHFSSSVSFFLWYFLY